MTTDSSSGRRWRWFVARQMDRLTGQCWSSLVDWALAWEPEEARPWKPSRPKGSGCYEDAARVGSCYCNKINPSEGRIS